jgi:hypothetical protein
MFDPDDHLQCLLGYRLHADLAHLIVRYVVASEPKEPGLSK